MGIEAWPPQNVDEALKIIAQHEAYLLEKTPQGSRVGNLGKDLIDPNQGELERRKAERAARRTERAAQEAEREAHQAELLAQKAEQEQKGTKTAEEARKKAQELAMAASETRKAAEEAQQNIESEEKKRNQERQARLDAKGAKYIEEDIPNIFDQRFEFFVYDPGKKNELSDDAKLQLKRKKTDGDIMWDAKRIIERGFVEKATGLLIDDEEPSAQVEVENPHETLALFQHRVWARRNYDFDTIRRDAEKVRKNRRLGNEASLEASGLSFPNEKIARQPIVYREATPREKLDAIKGYLDSKQNRGVAFDYEKARDYAFQVSRIQATDLPDLNLTPHGAKPPSGPPLIMFKSATSDWEEAKFSTNGIHVWEKVTVKSVESKGASLMFSLGGENRVTFSVKEFFSRKDLKDVDFVKKMKAEMKGIENDDQVHISFQSASRNPLEDACYLIDFDGKGDSEPSQAQRRSHKIKGEDRKFLDGIMPEGYTYFVDNPTTAFRGMLDEMKAHSEISRKDVQRRVYFAFGEQAGEKGMEIKYQYAPRSLWKNKNPKWVDNVDELPPPFRIKIPLSRIGSSAASSTVGSPNLSPVDSLAVDSLSESVGSLSQLVPGKDPRGLKNRKSFRGLLGRSNANSAASSAANSVVSSPTVESGNPLTGSIGSLSEGDPRRDFAQSPRQLSDPSHRTGSGAKPPRTPTR